MMDIDPGPYLELVVADNGPGIEQEIIDKIFDPFFTTKSKDVGTGLGLSVVHGIIKGHMGGIRVNSLPFERTEFKIYLPRINPIDGVISESSFISEAGDENILFVEDSREQRENVPRLLSGLGYTVTVKKNAREALPAVEAHPGVYDIVITDYDMPVTNGVELAEQLALLSPELPVIMVSGRAVANPTDLPNIKKFILKPYNKTVLSQAIRQVMDNEW